MGILFLIMLGLIIYFYPKWSYKEWEKRCEINTKHPDWSPYCGKSFFEEDSQWFINHGYAKYVKTGEDEPQ